MEEPKIWKQNIRIPQSLLEMKDELKLSVDSFANSFKKQTGELPVFHYLTFYNDDFQSGKVTLSIFSMRQKYIYLTAQEEDVERAVAKVKDMNKHLRFTELLMGHNGDDFLYNRVTIRFKIFTVDPTADMPPQSNTFSDIKRNL